MNANEPRMAKRVSRRRILIAGVAAAIVLSVGIGIGASRSASPTSSGPAHVNPSLSTLEDLNSAPRDGVSPFAVTLHKGEKIQLVLQVFNNSTDTKVIAHEIGLIDSKGLEIHDAYVLGPNNPSQRGAAIVGWERLPGGVDLQGATLMPSEGTAGIAHANYVVIRATVTADISRNGGVQVQVPGIRIKGSDSSGTFVNTFPYGLSGCADATKCKIPRSGSILEELKLPSAMGRFITV